MPRTRRHHNNTRLRGIKSGATERELQQIAARLGVPYGKEGKMGQLCNLITCPGCTRQLPAAEVIGICAQCKAAETAHEDARPDPQVEEQ